MPLSNFRRNKLIYVFKAFFGKNLSREHISLVLMHVPLFGLIDVDNSGAIDQEDFRLAAEVYNTIKLILILTISFQLLRCGLFTTITVG